MRIKSTLLVLAALAGACSHADPNVNVTGLGKDGQEIGFKPPTYAPGGRYVGGTLPGGSYPGQEEAVR